MTPELRSTALRALAAGSLGSIFSAIALMAFGRREVGSAVGPINSVSHWYWDREALLRRCVDVRHTLLGYLTHHGASVFWAGLYALALHRRPALQRPAAVLAGSSAASAMACFVDFNLTPDRLTPGYEHRLSRPALAGVYAAFALGLAVGTLMVGTRPAASRSQSEG